MVRRTIISCLRESAEQVMGPDSLERIGQRMSPEGRDACISPLLLASPRLPERFVVEWMIAAHAVAGTREVYYEHLSTMMGLGFGRVRRFLLSFANPILVAEKSAELWRHDHTHGHLELVDKGPSHARVRLSDHPYLQTAISRDAIAECLRSAIALTRVRNVEKSHAMIDDALEIRVSWDS